MLHDVARATTSATEAVQVHTCATDAAGDCTGVADAARATTSAAEAMQDCTSATDAA